MGMLIGAQVVFGSLAALVILAAGFIAGATMKRGFWPVILVVIAAFYPLFAALGEGGAALLPESLVMAGFVAIAVAGWRGSLWLVAGGLFVHGLFDLGYVLLESNPAPVWWGGFCCVVDWLLAAFLAYCLKRGLIPERARAA